MLFWFDELKKYTLIFILLHTKFLYFLIFFVALRIQVFVFLTNYY